MQFKFCSIELTQYHIYQNPFNVCKYKVKHNSSFCEVCWVYGASPTGTWRVMRSVSHQTSCMHQSAWGGEVSISITQQAPVFAETYYFIIGSQLLLLTEHNHGNRMSWFYFLTHLTSACHTNYCLGQSMSCKFLKICPWCKLNPWP